MLAILGAFLVSMNPWYPKKSIAILDEDDKAYTEYKGLPDDLNEHTLVFFFLDSAEVSDEKPKTFKERGPWNMKKLHNTRVPRSNAQLIETAQNYPFEYINGRRSDLEDYISKGYKYAFDFVPFVNAQNGIIMSNRNYNVKFPVHVKDLKNGDIYILGYEADKFVYNQKGIMKKYLLRAVKSKFR